ncbi:chemotaxis protein CheW [Parathalassolituus penaei]|uniref:Chemotaxis protein CheW n=1 Tax=Parathalassolituus penaei TaxID=2997323 RepID=A0A9X3ENK4_9GAMM|nr:chemotaxis protein CheW [Parathalassolituus penaei]MCY0967441.1 chemotaxis protein CheW [Parathalassolituus penaei]
MSNLSDQYGVFRLGELRLAVPLDHLKEVMPLTRIEPLPSAAACMPGAANLRGSLVPLLDPDVLMGLTATSRSHSIVIVVQVEGFIYGLLGDSLEGVVDAPRDGMSYLSPEEETSEFLLAAFPHPDGNGFVCLINMPALLRLPGVPRIRNRVVTNNFTELSRVVNSHDSQHLMLFSVGRMLLALETSSVVATLQSPKIEEAVTENPVYRGDMFHLGQRVSTVSTGALLGIDYEYKERCQGFILRIGDGMVTFLVDHIIDVVSARLSELPLMPSGMFPAAAFYSGACKTESLFHVSDIQRFGVTEDYFLLLNATALMQCPALQDLARLSASSVKPQAETSEQKRINRGYGQALVFDAGVRLASQVSSICEILPLSRQVDLFNAAGYARGLVMLRGKPVPIFCLNGLIGRAPPTELTPTSSILVVQKDYSYIGFMVPTLYAIGDIIWMRSNRDTVPEGSAGSAARGCWGLIKYNSDDGHETCLSLDLSMLADQVLKTGSRRGMDFAWIEQGNSGNDSSHDPDHDLAVVH